MAYGIDSLIDPMVKRVPLFSKYGRAKAAYKIVRWNVDAFLHSFEPSKHFGGLNVSITAVKVRSNTPSNYAMEELICVKRLLISVEGEELPVYNPPSYWSFLKNIFKNFIP